MKKAIASAAIRIVTIRFRENGSDIANGKEVFLGRSLSSKHYSATSAHFKFTG